MLTSQLPPLTACGGTRRQTVLQFNRDGIAREVILQIMKPSTAFYAHRDAIRAIVESRRALNPRVFGSVAHGCDTENSDLDLVVDPTPEMTLFDIGAIQQEL